MSFQLSMLFAARLPLFLSLLVIASACEAFNGDNTEDAANREGFENFHTAVAADRNYEIYWLGREFQAAGLVYKGPEVARFADDVEGGGLGMHYLSDCTCSNVKLVMYSRSAWAFIQERRTADPSASAETKAVHVAGRAAELRTNRRTTRAVASLILTIDFGDTFVEALTGSVVPATPGPEPNPLMDEATFLAVMQKLRPYPD